MLIEKISIILIVLIGSLIFSFFKKPRRAAEAVTNENKNIIPHKTHNQKKKYLFLIWANILAAFNWFIFYGLVSNTKAEGPVGLFVIFTVPVLLGSAYLLMVVAYIRDERPVWAYLTIILSPLIVIPAIVTSSSEASFADGILFLLVIIGVGLIFIGIGKIIKVFLQKRIDDRTTDSLQAGSIDNLQKRFIIKSAMLISIINGFFIISFFKDEFGAIIVSLLGLLTLFTLFLILVSKFKSENPTFIEVLVSNISLLASLVATAYYSVWFVFWIIISILIVIEPVIWFVLNKRFKIWMRVVFSIISLVLVVSSFVMINEYLDKKNTERIEQEGINSVMEELQNLEVNGNWVMFSQGSFKHDVILSYTKDGLLKIESDDKFGGIYVCEWGTFHKNPNRDVGWNIVDKDSIKLDYGYSYNVVLLRGDKLSNLLMTPPDPDITGKWKIILPDGSMHEVNVDYIGKHPIKSLYQDIYIIDSTDTFKGNYELAANQLRKIGTNEWNNHKFDFIWEIVSIDEMRISEGKFSGTVMKRTGILK